MTASYMKALQWSQARGHVALIEVPAPQTPSTPNHAIIKVAYAGVCGSDLHIMSGDYLDSDNIIMGHETSGIVTAVGADVTSCAVGDAVVVKPNTHCGKCYFCLRGHINCCIPDSIYSSYGVVKPGGWAEYSEVAGELLFLLPKWLGLDQGILCEPYSCILHGFERCGLITDDKEVLVMGAGIIGLLWTCLLHYKGSRKVTVIEISEERRKMVTALDLGFKVHHPDEVKLQMDAGKPDVDGFDLIVDCTGSARAAEMAFEWLRRRATYNMFGICPKTAMMKIHPAELMRREITLTGSLIDLFTYPRTLSLVENMAARYLTYEKLGIRTYAMEESAQAFADLKAGKVSKAVFKIGAD